MYVLSRGFSQPVIVTRDINGKATGFHATRVAYAPKLWTYGVPFVVKEGFGAGVAKNWTVCIVPDGTVLSAATLADADNIQLNYARATPLTLGERTNLTTQLLSTDFGVISVLTGDTLDAVIDKIVKGPLGHSAGFVASALTHTAQALGVG